MGTIIEFYPRSRRLKIQNGRKWRKKELDQGLKLRCLPIVSRELYVLRVTNVRTSIHKKKKSFSRPEKLQRPLMIRNFLIPSFAPSCVIRLTYPIIERCAGLLMVSNSLSVRPAMKLDTRRRLVPNKKKKF